MLQPAPSAERAPKRVSSQGKHLWHALHRAGTRQAVSPTITPYGLASRALWPWTRHEYPGFRAGMVKVLGDRIKPLTVRHWVAGRRRAPQWAWHLLLNALERRRAELDHAIELAKKEAGL